MNVAIIENDIVINVIVCDSIELAKNITRATEVLDADENKIGMYWKRVNGVWQQPEQ